MLCDTSRTRGAGLTVGTTRVQLANLVCKVEAENAADGAAAPPGGAATAATTTGGSFVNFCAEGSHLQRIVTQVLPAVLVIVWQNAIMPLALYGITLFESTHVSLSALDRRMLTLFFWWNCFNVFFGSMIAGSLTQQLRNLIEAPGNITDVLGESLATSSNFFINYVALRAFGLVPFRLVLVHGGIWRWLGKCAPDAPTAAQTAHARWRCLCGLRHVRAVLDGALDARARARRCGGKCGCVTTARDEAAFMAPASIRYGREVGVMMLVFIVAWAYCLVSPILIVVAAIYFMSSWVVWRWQIIYVYVRCYEGGGEIWRTIVQCLMLSMLIFTFFMSCVFVAKEAFYQAAILFIVMPIVIFVVWCAPLQRRASPHVVCVAALARCVGAAGAVLRGARALQAALPPQVRPRAQVHPAGGGGARAARGHPLDVVRVGAPAAAVQRVAPRVGQGLGIVGRTVVPVRRLA